VDREKADLDRASDIDCELGEYLDFVGKFIPIRLLEHQIAKKG